VTSKAGAGTFERVMVCDSIVEMPRRAGNNRRLMVILLNFIVFVFKFYVSDYRFTLTLMARDLQGSKL
jgi:hypothetical protein